MVMSGPKFFIVTTEPLGIGFKFPIIIEDDNMY